MNLTRFCSVIALSLAIKTHGQMALTSEKDEDIVIVNIGDGNRAFIGDLISRISECEPLVIGIDVWFTEEKIPTRDDVLVNALKVAQHDVLGYTTTSTGYKKSHRKFSKHAEREALAVVQENEGIAKYVTPLYLIRGEVHQHFAFALASYKDEDIEGLFEVNQRVKIDYQRTLDGFHMIEGDDFNTLKHRDTVKDRIVILGYAGPGDEDKHFTPMRELIDVDEEPDTYGVVIIGNEIRTILEMNDKDNE